MVAALEISLSSNTRDGFVVLTVGGSIDMETSPELRAGLDELLAGGASKLVVDLGGVDFLDSSALGVLVGVRKQMGAAGVLRVACADPSLVRLFEITRLTEMLTVVPSVDDALAP